MRQLLYRLGQFKRARQDAPSPEGLVRAREALSPQLFDLFSQMLPFEQAHAVRVYDGLISRGKDDPDLLAAGLLHDVGKARRPLRPWERAAAVTVKALLPGAFAKWGQGKPHGLAAGIVVAAQHAGWGAQMAADAGAGERLVRLIRCHDAELAQVPEPDRQAVAVLQAEDAVN